MSEEERILLDVEFVKDNSNYRFICFHKFDIDYVNRHGFDFRIIDPENDDVLLKSTFTFFGGLRFPTEDFDHNKKLMNKPFLDRNHELFFFGVKKWLNVMFQNRDRWNEFNGKKQGQLPDDIQDQIRIEKAENDEEQLVTHRDQAKFLVMDMIKTLIFEFSRVCLAEIYFSSSLRLKDINKVFDYFGSTQITILRKYSNTGYLYMGHDQHIKPDKFDKLYDKLEPIWGSKIATSTANHSLFKDVKLLYDEEKFVFVIMPFSDEKFAWLGEENDEKSLRHFISSNSKAPCITLDDDHESDDRVAKIYNYIKKSKFCIAEISSLRPNIVYEVGLAHGIGRKVILLCSMPDLRIQHPELTDKELFKKYLEDTFDINHNRIHFFDDNQELKSLLEIAIKQTIRKS